MSTDNDHPLRKGLRKYLNEKQLELLASSRVGICGCGGLGSNAAMLLARSGVEKLVLVDFDVVDHSNLNRQHYWPGQVGSKKVTALADNLLGINPQMDIECLDARIDADNLPSILSLCPIWVEALDAADSKTLFVEQALLHDCRVVSASGICGIGGPPMLKRHIGKLVLVGDFHTSQEHAPPMAPRVTQASALIADSVLEILLGLQA